MKKFIKTLASIIASFALFVGITSINSPSAILYYQPEVPKEMYKYKRG